MKIKESFSERGIMFNLQRSRITVSMTLILSILVIFACLTGILEKNIYEDVLSAGTITEVLVVGSIAQDIMFVPLGLLLATLSIMFLRRPSYRKFVTILGLTGNFLYGYGLYTMQGQYTSIYLIYLAIFSLAIYSIVFGLLSFTAEFTVKASLPRTLRISIVIFLSIIVLMLGLVWTLRITPDIARHIPQDTYGVFVLDLGIVFPAIAITAMMLIRSKPFGNILAGVVLMKIFTVCLSWGFGEWYSRYSGSIQGSYGMLVIPTVLTMISLVFYVQYLYRFRTIDAESQ